MTGVGIYARISRDRDGSGQSGARQLSDCRRKASERGWVVVDEYVDDDVSAYTGKARPEYERMLADLRSARIHGVVVYHTDRLTRHPRDLEDGLTTDRTLRVKAAAVRRIEIIRP